MRTNLIKAVIVWAALCAGVAYADGFDGQRMKSPMFAAGGFQLERPWILKHLGLGGGLVMHYGYQPVVERLRPSGLILDVPLRHAFTMDMMFSIGLGGFVELGIELPVHAYFAGDATVFGGAQPILANAGVGDLRLGPKFIFYRTGHRTFHWSIGMAIPVSFPTGDAAALRGSGGFVLDPKLVFGIGGWRWELYANGGYQWRSNNGPANLYGFGEITYGLGLIITLPVWKDRIDLAGELVGGYNHSGVGSELVKSPLETLLGIIIRPHPIVSVFAGAGAGLTSGLGTPDARAFAGVRIAWRLQNRNDFADDDKDGVSNADDRCPRAAEDRDGFQDDDGCPEDDNDRDGISDDDDECPDQPEEPGGDRDGCPEKTYVTVRHGRLYIFGKVQFESDSTRITAKSQPLLDQIAVALRGHPELSDVRVQGHTDNVGGRDYNEKLSRERAEAVKHALMRRGVAEGRLNARGLGEARPIASNQTKGGRAKNRRVEFVTRD